jgi:hypothetical protein
MGKFLRYLLGTPVFGFLYLCVYYVVVVTLFLFGEVTPPPPALLGKLLLIALAALKFPFGYFHELEQLPVNWLDGLLGDTSFITPADLINAVFWGAAITWASGFLRKRLKRRYT